MPHAPVVMEKRPYPSQLFIERESGVEGVQNEKGHRAKGGRTCLVERTEDPPRKPLHSGGETAGGSRQVGEPISSCFGAPPSGIELRCCVCPGSLQGGGAGAFRGPRLLQNKVRTYG